MDEKELLEKAFEAGYRAYREEFDHYNDPDEIVESSLKWRMAEYAAGAAMPCEKCGTRSELWKCRVCGHDNRPANEK